MARAANTKAAISQRERVSLVAELLLEGALIAMDSAGPVTRLRKEAQVFSQRPS